MLQTPLIDAHRRAGAKLVEFAGWELPLHYGSQIEEHHAVRRAAGMFDTSHMLAIDVEGAGARAFLLRALANNVERLKRPGKASWSVASLRRMGTFLSPARWAARHRRSPTMSSYPSPLGRTTRGCRIPCSRMD